MCCHSCPSPGDRCNICVCKKKQTKKTQKTFVKCHNVAYRSNMYPDTADIFWVVIWKPKVLLLCLVPLTQEDRMWGQWHHVVFQDMSPPQTCSALAVFRVRGYLCTATALCRPLLSETSHTTVWWIHSPLPSLCAVWRSRAAAQRGSFATKQLLPELQQQMRRACWAAAESLWAGSLSLYAAALTPLPAPLSCVQECRRSAAMVETPAGCVFEDIQYEDIEVEAVNFTGTSALLRGATCSGSGAFVLLRICVLWEREGGHRSFRSDPARVMRSSVSRPACGHTHRRHVNEMGCEHSSD